MKGGSTASLLLGVTGLLLSGAPTTRAGCPMRGALTVADGDLTNEEAIGLKLDRTLHEVWNPSGHPSRKLMNAGKDDGKDGFVFGEDADDQGDGQESDDNATEAVTATSDGLKEPEENPLFSGNNVLPPLTQEQYDMIVADLTAVLSDSKDFFPADFGGANGGSYLGLFTRLAWHCAGSYRNTDGRGGCDGARIRFAPEFLWEDNTNLDKALRLLEPSYAKFSDIISWGDLIILMGNTAIASSGGPILGFCGGRIDDADGTASIPLGPTSVQQQLMPCEEPFDGGPEGATGDCPAPLGPAVIGLIYVEANGPGDAPSDTIASAAQIRRIFSRMSFVTDREQVALIGGGHIIGKLHGACPDGPGPGPREAPADPYVGTCATQPLEEGVTGVGTGLNTFTAGFEGPWTTSPTDWDNEYFTNLLEYKWELGEAPGGGGRMQWFPFDFETGEPGPEIVMLTTDIAFIDDPEYRAIVEEFANDSVTFDREFAAAWYKLTTADMGPASRCTGPAVPEAEPFQDPLPEPSATTGADLSGVESAVRGLLSDAAHRELIGNLGFQCASTFRTTSWFGGCNGGRIRFEPQLSFSTNQGASEALALLQPVYEQYADSLSFADLIVFASTEALSAAGGPAVPFCPGRVDAEDGVTDTDFSPRTYYLDPLVAQRDTIDILGVSAAEWTALVARPKLGSPDVSNQIFKDLVDNTWEPVLEGDAIKADPITGQYKSVENPELVIPISTWVLLRDPETLFYVKEFAANPEALNAQLGKAWVYLMNADRFEGPVGNVCSAPEFQFHA